MTTWILLFNLFLPHHSAAPVAEALTSAVGAWDDAQMRYHGIEELLAKFAAADPA